MSAVVAIASIEMIFGAIVERIAKGILRYRKEQ